MRKFVSYCIKLIIGTAVIIGFMGIWDVYYNIMMLPNQDIMGIQESDDVFLGSSHTLYHINTPYYDSLTHRKAHVVATGAQYGLETIHYLHLLGEKGLLKDKIVYVQLETKENINRHPQKSWMMLNTKPQYINIIYSYGSSAEYLEYVRATFVDFLSIEFFLKRKMTPYKFVGAEEIRREVPFEELEYVAYKHKGNGHFTDKFGQELIDQFLDDRSYYEKKYECQIVYYIAGGCHSNYYKQIINDLRWFDFMSKKKYWQDTNHLNSKGSKLYTKSLIEYFAKR